MARPLAKHEVEFILTAKDLTKKTFKGVGGAFPRLASAAAGAAIAFTAMGTAAVVATKHYADFQTELVALGKVTTQDINKLKDKILELPPELGSATDLVKGLYQVISAGITDPVKSMDTLVIAAKASKAAHLDLGTTVAGLTNVMDGFKGKIDSVADASDLLFTIERVGKTQFEALAPVIGQVATASNELGLSLDEMGGLFATVTKTAGSTDIAATQVRATILALLTPSAAMAKVLKDLDYESGKVAISQKGLAGALTAVIGEANKTGVSLNDLFKNQRAFLGIAPIVKDNFKTLTENIGEMGKRTGSTEKAFVDFSNTIEGQSDAIRAQIGKISIQIVDEFAPDILAVLKATLAGIQEFGKGWKGVATATQSVSNTIGLAFSFMSDTVADFVEGWLDAETKINSFLGNVGITFNKVGTVVGAGMLRMKGVAVKELGVLQATTITTLNGLGQVFSDEFGKYPPIVSAAMGLIGSSVDKELKKVKANIGAGLTASITKATKDASKEAKKGGSEIGKSFALGMESSNSIKLYDSAGKLVSETFMKNLTSTNSVELYKEGGEKVSSSVAEGATSTNSITVLENATTSVGTVLEGLIPKAKTVGDDTGKGLMETIRDTVKANSNLPIKEIDAVMTEIGTLLEEMATRSAADTGKAINQVLSEEITATSPKTINAIKSLMEDIDEYFAHSDAKKGPLSTLTDSGKAIPETLAKGITASSKLLQQATARAMSLVTTEIDKVIKTIGNIPAIDIPVKKAISNVKALVAVLGDLKDKTVKVTVNMGSSLSDVRSLKAAIDSIDDVTIKKVIVKTVTEASPEMPFTKGIEYIKGKIREVGGVQKLTVKATGPGLGNDTGPVTGIGGTTGSPRSRTQGQQAVNITVNIKANEIDQRNLPDLATKIGGAIADQIMRDQSPITGALASVGARR